MNKSKIITCIIVIILVSAGISWTIADSLKDEKEQIQYGDLNNNVGNKITFDITGSYNGLILSGTTTYTIVTGKINDNNCEYLIKCINQWVLSKNNENTTYVLDTITTTSEYWANGLIDNNQENLGIININTIYGTKDCILYSKIGIADDNTEYIQKTFASTDEDMITPYKMIYTNTSNNIEIIYELSKIDQKYSMNSKGLVTINYLWSYNSESQEVTLEIYYSDIENYISSEIQRNQGTEEHAKLFVTADDQYIKSLADQITKKTNLMTDIEKGEYLLSFIQSFEYVEDSIYEETNEYWKFPLETLFDTCGDCEDLSILYCSIAKNLGLDCALLIYYSHVAVGVYIDGKGSENGYYYCETSSNVYSFGNKPWFVSSLIKCISI